VFVCVRLRREHNRWNKRSENPEAGCNYGKKDSERIGFKCKRQAGGKVHKMQLHGFALQGTGQQKQ
jgi:hypothetical protein